jgi:hypothetical protein
VAAATLLAYRLWRRYRYGRAQAARLGAAGPGRSRAPAMNRNPGTAGD